MPNHAFPYRRFFHVGPILFFFAIVSTCCLSSAWAAETESDAGALPPVGRTIAFDIGPQGLADALLLFSKQSGVQVAFKSQEARGRHTQGLIGSASADEALRILLSGTGANVEWISVNSVVVSIPPAPDDLLDGSADQLDALRVEALRSITSYAPTDGYVSYHSVAATKTDTPVIETPQSVSTIAKEELAARDVKTIAEAVRYTPGIVVDSYGVDPRGYDSIKIRGFDSATTGSFRDGMRMDGNFFAVYMTEPYGIERVDVMRGPSGALYGQAEAGGVVDRTTKRPDADMQQEVKLEVGSWNQTIAAADVGGKLSDDGHLLYRVTGLIRNGDTEFDYNDGTRQQNDRVFVAPAFTWAPSEDTSFTVLADYMKDNRSTMFTTFGNEEIGRTNAVIGEPDFDRFEQEQYAIGYMFEHAINDVFSFRQNARYTHVEIDYQTVAADYLEADGVTLQRYVWSSPDELDQWAIDNQLEAKFNWGPTFHTVLAGFDYTYSKDIFAYHYGAVAPLDITNVVYTGATMPEPYQKTRQDLEQMGIYMQDQIAIGDPWIVTLGGRFSWVEQETEDRLAGTSETKKDDAFTTCAGVTYVFDNGWAPYIAYTEGFVPTEGTNLSGESFEPEESTQYEVGIKYQPDSTNLLFTAAVFDLTKTNVLTRDPANINASRQAGEIRSRGLELELKAGLFNGWDVAAAYAYTDAEVTKSNDIDLHKSPVGVPEHTASLWVNHRISGGALNGLSLGAGVRYIGSAYNDTANTSKADSYTLVDATMAYDISKDLTLKVNANNLFDKEYIATCAFGACYWGTGRRVNASLTYRW